MNVVLEAYELEQRELERECRKSHGFGFDDIPPMSAAEMKAREAAANATGACNHSGRRPTYQQMQKIKRYNAIARRYRALADAKLALKKRKVNALILQERAAGTYVEPGIDQDARIGAIFLGILCLPVIWLAIALDGFFGDLFSVMAAVGVVGTIVLYFQEKHDPRIAPTVRERDRIHRFWKIV